MVDKNTNFSFGSKLTKPDVRRKRPHAEGRFSGVNLLSILGFKRRLFQSVLYLYCAVHFFFVALIFLVLLQFSSTIVVWNFPWKIKPSNGFMLSFTDSWQERKKSLSMGSRIKQFFYCCSVEQSLGMNHRERHKSKRIFPRQWVRLFIKVLLRTI